MRETQIETEKERDTDRQGQRYRERRGVQRTAKKRMEGGVGRGGGGGQIKRRKISSIVIWNCSEKGGDDVGNQISFPCKWLLVRETSVERESWGVDEP